MYIVGAYHANMLAHVRLVRKCLSVCTKAGLYVSLYACMCMWAGVGSMGMNMPICVCENMLLCEGAGVYLHMCTGCVYVNVAPVQICMSVC